MPLHLDLMNRRNFLSGVAGLLSPVALPEDVVATSLAGSSWALLSDTHIAGNLGERRHGVCMAANARKVIAEIVDRDGGDAGVIVNGDCAHLFGKGQDYANFSELVDPLIQSRRGLHLLLGNHDDRDAFGRACGCAGAESSLVPGKRTSFLPAEEANWFFLDSLETGRLVSGRIGEDQLIWLAAMLDRHKDKPAIVVAHHHLQPVVGKSASLGPGGGLKDSAALLKLLTSQRQVKAYLHGHTHRWGISQTREGLYVVNLPSTAYVFERPQPSGWVDARLSHHGMRVELRSLDSQHPDHGVPQFLRWRK